MSDRPKYLSEICGNCGFTQGSHLSCSCYSNFYKQYFPAHYCPGHESKMDWDKGPGTVFKPTGKYKED